MNPLDMAWEFLPWTWIVGGVLLLGVVVYLISTRDHDI